MLRHGIQVRRVGEGQAVARPGGARGVVLEHPHQHGVEAVLFERRRHHAPGVGLGDVVGVAADVGDQHRQAGDQRLEQHGAGVLVVGRVDQQVGAEQEARDVAAALEDLHVVGQAEGLDLQQERLGIVLADDDQPGALLQRARQRGEGLEAAVQALGLEAGADLHQQQVIVGELEFAAELGADFRGVRRRAAVLGDARRQQVEALRRRAVVLDEQRLLHLGDHQDLGLRLRVEHRALVVGEVAVAAELAVQRVAQGLRLVLEAGVGGVVGVQPGHLVEADHPVHRTLLQVRSDPGGEFLVAPVVEQRLHRRHQHLEAGRHLAFPDQRVDADRVAAALALQGDAHEVALQPTEREVLVEDESQGHRSVSGASSRASSWVATRCGCRRVKHRGCSRRRSNWRRSSAVGW
ncbi:hypothetical protein D9M68_633350 [compost metagenome]